MEPLVSFVEENNPEPIIVNNEQAIHILSQNGISFEWVGDGYLISLLIDNKWTHIGEFYSFGFIDTSLIYTPRVKRESNQIVYSIEYFDNLLSDLESNINKENHKIDFEKDLIQKFGLDPIVVNLPTNRKIIEINEYLKPSLDKIVYNGAENYLNHEFLDIAQNFKKQIQKTLEQIPST